MLQAKRLGLAPGDGPSDPSSAFGFLASALSPPHPMSVANAVELLKQLGALGGREELTQVRFSYLLFSVFFLFYFSFFSIGLCAFSLFFSCVMG